MNQLDDYDIAIDIQELMAISECETDSPITEMYKFMEKCFELAFGDGAIANFYSMKDVLAKLEEFSQKAHDLDELNKEDHF